MKFFASHGEKAEDELGFPSLQFVKYRIVLGNFCNDLTVRSPKKTIKKKRIIFWWFEVGEFLYNNPDISRYHIPRHFQKSKLRRTLDVLTTVKPKLSRLEDTDPGSFRDLILQSP